MAKYLVTGAAGFIGSRIAQKLLDMGHFVTTVDNLSTGCIESIPEGCVFIEGDISNIGVVAKLNYQKFDAILHIAGQSSGEVSFEDPSYDINSNTVSTVLLLDYAVKTDCKRFIYASTMSVYGQQGQQERFCENSVPCPKSFYAIGKLASEHYLRIYGEQYGIRYTALRYFNVYGDGQNLSNLKQGMVSIYLKQFLDDNFQEVTVKGSLDRFRDLSYIDDVVDATVDSIGNVGFLDEIVNIGTGKKTTVGEILSLIAKYLQSDKDIVVTSGTPGDQFGIYADISKLRSRHHKKFLSFDNGLKKTLKNMTLF